MSDTTLNINADKLLEIAEAIAPNTAWLYTSFDYLFIKESSLDLDREKYYQELELDKLAGKINLLDSQSLFQIFTGHFVQNANNLLPKLLNSYDLTAYINHLYRMPDDVFNKTDSEDVEYHIKEYMSENKSKIDDLFKDFVHNTRPSKIIRAGEYYIGQYFPIGQYDESRQVGEYRLKEIQEQQQSNVMSLKDAVAHTLFDNGLKQYLDKKFNLDHKQKIKP